jgi:EndoU nuclease-like protein/pretoxin HINT domain-containing protein
VLGWASPWSLLRSLEGALGELGSGLLGAVGGKALDAVGGLFGRGVADAGAESAGAAAEDVGTGEATSSVDGGGGEPSAGAEDDAGPGCRTGMPHSFTGATRVLMADGSSKPISRVRAGDEVRDSVPGKAGTQVHTVQKVIVTRTDHDFVEVTIAPVKAGLRRTSASAAGRLRSKAKLGIAAVAATAAVVAGGQPAMAATTHGAAKAPAPAAAVSGAAVRGGMLTTTFHHPFYDETQAAFTQAEDLHAGDVLHTPAGTAQVTGVRLFHANTTTYHLTINGLHTYYVEAGTTPVLVHNNNGCPDISAEAREHVLPGVVTDDGRFAGWHLHPDQSGGIPDDRFINGELVTNADGTVRVAGTVGARLENGQTIQKVATAGHTFFPANWTAEDVMAAGEDLLANGTYKRGGTMVKGVYQGVKMTGFLEKTADGTYTPSTFFPVGG